MIRSTFFAALLLAATIGSGHAQKVLPDKGGGGTSLSPATAAAAGTNQGTATAITAGVTIVTTVSAGQGVILTAAYQTVINAGANTLLVYPNSGATITGGGTTLAANAAFSIAAGSSATFTCPSTTACYVSFSSFQ